MKKRDETFIVTGMSCASCAMRVAKTLRGQVGVEQADVNYAAATTHVVYDAEQTSPEALRDAVRQAGYDLLLHTDRAEADDLHARAYKDQLHRTLIAVALTVPMMVMSMVFGAGTPWVRYALWLLSTPVVFVLGRQFFVTAWKQLRHGTSNMDTLVACSTLTAYVFSCFNLFFPNVLGINSHVYFESAAGIITFILIGRTLEERAKMQTGSAIKKLMGLQPQTVTLVCDGVARSCPIASVMEGDEVIVKAGERIPVDGVVSRGNPMVDESMLTGEPQTVNKRVGEDVYAGAINQRTSFHFIAYRVGADTVLARIIRAVQDAQNSKAPVQKLVDRVAAVFVPVIISVAFLSMLAWIVADPSDAVVTHAVLAFVTVLIIACPCALGLATPTALMVGMGRGAENGILIRDALSLEVARKVDTVVLDKTGTLTEGVVGEQGIVTGDRLKPTSRAAVAELRRMGLRVVMLSGDKPEAARAIAREAGISDVVAGVLPNGKCDEIKRLQRDGSCVCMAGDGINDSAALAQADLSIAMGSGSDIAMDAAMVTIMRSDLAAIATTIRLSRATVGIIRENLFLAFVYNLVAVPIAAGVLYPFTGFLLNPMIASACMAFSSVSVVLNSLRLKRVQLSAAHDGGTDAGQLCNNQTNKMMKTEYKISGMMCQHCRRHVEDALNSLDGVTATVSLATNTATIESCAPVALETLQTVVREKAGEDYKIESMEP